jgi:hypothetical protein
MQKKPHRSRDLEEFVNITFCLRGQDAKDFNEYKEQEIIDTHAIAGKKLALERLRQWRAQRAQSEPVAA